MTWFRDHFIHQSPRKRAILLLGLLTLGYALLMPDRAAIGKNYLFLLGQQTYLLQDFFATAGLSTTFLNAALHFFVAYFLMSRNERSQINGLQIGAIGIFVGHAFFGTHILNILPILIGVVLYAHWSHQSYKLFTTVSLFATATAPFVSLVALYPGLSLWSIGAASLVGLILGFIAPPLAEHYLKFHNGFSLYNYGFTTGMIATFFALSLPYLGWELPSTLLILQENQHFLLIYICLVLFAGWGIVIPNWKAAWTNYGKLLHSSGRLPDDFVAKFGLYSTLLNCCINGGIYLTFFLIARIPLTGPSLGALCSLIGFSAFGKQPRNSLPVSLGIFLACWLVGDSLTSVRLQLALLFGTGLAPVAGFYGLGYGLLAGFLHYNLTVVAFGLHQGLALYNNGFTTGLVAAFITPIIESIENHKPTWNRKK